MKAIAVVAAAVTVVVAVTLAASPARASGDSDRPPVIVTLDTSAGEIDVAVFADMAMRLR